MRRSLFLDLAAFLLIGFGATTGRAQILPDVNEPNNSAEEATEVECNFTSPILNIQDDEADIDWFSFEVEGDEPALVTATVDCEINGGLLDSLIAIVDEDGNVLALNDDFDFLCSQITIALDPGTYFLVVTGYPDFDLDGASDGGPEFPKSFGEYVFTLTCVQPIPLVDYSFGGGGMARDAVGNRASIRVGASGEALGTNPFPFGENSADDNSDIGGSGFSAYLYSSRTRITQAGPATRAAIIDYGGGIFEAILDVPALVNGQPRTVEIYLNNFGPTPFFQIADLTNFVLLYSGNGIAGQSSANGDVSENVPE